MLAFISLFFPTFISLAVIEKRNKKSLSSLLFIYPIYNLIVNSFAFLIYALIKENELISISNHFSFLQFNLKYILLASAIALIFPYLEEFFRKNIKLKLEFKKDKNEK